MEAGTISGNSLSPLGGTNTNDNMAVTAYDAAAHVLSSGGGLANGQWSIKAPVGTVYLGFHQTPYADQYYNGKGGLACANPLIVTFNAYSNVNSVQMSYSAPSPCASTGGGTEPGGTGGNGATGGTGGTGGTGSGGTGETASAAKVLALLGSEITPTGTPGRISAILKAARYVLSFRALESGTALVNWLSGAAGRARRYDQTHAQTGG